MQQIQDKNAVIIVLSQTADGTLVVIKLPMWEKQAVLWNTGSKNTSMLSLVGMLTSQQLQNTWQ